MPKKRKIAPKFGVIWGAIFVIKLAKNANNKKQKTAAAGKPWEIKVYGGALIHYISNQDISKWHFSAHGAV